ncbi:MAG: acetylornithine deacetylase [Myxococcota bacterium]
MRSTVELARELISFPTVSRDSNLELIDFVASYLRGFGIEFEIQKDATGLKANLIATIGPTDRPGVILSGHTDVVPIDGQNWSRDPFDPWLAEDRLFGRGSCDMKGFIAAVLATVPRMNPARLQTPIHLLMTYDEEVGCHGAREAVGILTKRLGTPAACIVGEPTDMEPVNAHKGMKLLKTSVHGRAGHSSSQTHAVSAIAEMAQVLDYLSKRGEELRNTAPPPATTFEYPHTTINLGVIRGGAAINIVPEFAELLWEYRHLPGVDGEVLLQKFAAWCESRPAQGSDRQGNPLPRIETEEIASLPALSSQGSEGLLAVLGTLLEHDEGHCCSAQQVDYCTEAGLFQESLRTPTLICGPGSITQAHRPDEFVTLPQLDAATRFVERVVARCETDAPFVQE